MIEEGCPEHGIAHLKMENGCMSCMICGWSKCEN